MHLISSHVLGVLRNDGYTPICARNRRTQILLRNLENSYLFFTYKFFDLRKRNNSTLHGQSIVMDTAVINFIERYLYGL